MLAPTTREQLIKDFGKQKVTEVEEIVSLSDPDFAYSTYQDQEDEDACSIIEALYFDNELSVMDIINEK